MRVWLSTWWLLIREEIPGNKNGRNCLKLNTKIENKNS
jgi:hypothetical protein